MVREQFRRCNAGSHPDCRAADRQLTREPANGNIIGWPRSWGPNRDPLIVLVVDLPGAQ